MENELNDQELATVLAALRLFQRHRVEAERSIHFCATRDSPQPLTNEQIDELCERLNCY